MDSQQKYPVGVLRKHPPINPLSLWERARVRVFRRPTEVSDVKHRPVQWSTNSGHLDRWF